MDTDKQPTNDQGDVETGSPDVAQIADQTETVPHTPGQQFLPNSSEVEPQTASPVVPPPPVPAPPIPPSSVIMPPTTTSNTQPVPSVMPLSSAVPTRPKFRPPRFALLIIGVVLLVGGLGTIIYANIMNNRPEKVLADALSNTLADILAKKPMSTIGKLTYEYTAGQDGKMTLDYTTNSSEDNFHGEASLRMEFDDTDITVKGAVITTDSEVYVRFDELQKLLDSILKSSSDFDMVAEIADAFKPIIAKIDGKWIKIDEAGLSELGLIDSRDEYNQCVEAVEELRLGRRDKRKVRRLFLDNQFLVTTEKLPKETIDGDDSYHYKLDYRNAQTIEFVKEFVELDFMSEVREKCELNDIDFEKQLEEIRNQTSDEEAGGLETLEMWVSTKTRHPTKLKATSATQSVTMEFVLDTKFNDGTVDVQIPDEFITLQQLRKEIDQIVGELIGASLGGVGNSPNESENRDTERRIAINSLHTQLELYYAGYGHYPTLEQINSANFRSQHSITVEDSAFQDPLGTSPGLVSSPTTNAYLYQPRPAGCGPSSCRSYTLSATLENEFNGSKSFGRQSLNN